MNGFLEDILAAEAEGRRLAAAARERAAGILAAAAARAGAAAAAAREAGRLEAERVAAEILREAGREKAARLAAARAEIERTLSLEEPELRRLADEVARQVLETK